MLPIYGNSQSTAWKYHGGELLFVGSPRGISATYKVGRRTERYFGPRNFNFNLNEDGEARWTCELLHPLASINCYSVRPIRQTELKSGSSRVRDQILKGKNIVARDLDATWSEVVDSFGPSEAMEMAIEAGEQWTGSKWQASWPPPESFV